MKKYRAVFLDWDDTVGDWIGSSTQAHRVLFDEHHFAEFVPSFDEWLSVYRAHNNDLWDAYAAGTITRDFLHIDQFLWPICQFMHMPVETAPAAMRERCRLMGDEYIELTNRFCALTADAQRVLEYLSQRYPLTIVSNGYVEAQYYKMEHTGAKPFFKFTVFSEEAGVMKPDPRIFDIAIQRNRALMPDLQPDECIMIGDSYHSDILGAKNAGIDAIWWPHVGPEPTPEQLADATHVVTSLADVMDIL